MDATPEGSEQVHRVKAKPGPKPKGVMSSFSSMPAPAASTYKIESVQVYADNWKSEAPSKAQSLALRIWSGQSVDVPVIERVARIAAGLKEQGFSLDVDLPHPDAARYMEAHK